MKFISMLIGIQERNYIPKWTVAYYANLKRDLPLLDAIILKQRLLRVFGLPFSQEKKLLRDVESTTRQSQVKS